MEISCVLFMNEKLNSNIVAKHEITFSRNLMENSGLKDHPLNLKVKLC